MGSEKKGEEGKGGGPGREDQQRSGEKDQVFCVTPKSFGVTQRMSNWKEEYKLIIIRNVVIRNN